MSVYTSVSAEQLGAFLTQYALGTLQHHEGILAGVENSNYFVSTSQGEYVLTLFEQHTAEELPYFLYLMQFWAQHDIPTPTPLPNHHGSLLSELNGKPAALVQRLAGQEVKQANIEQCHTLGICLAKMHLTGQSFPLHRASDRGHTWRMETARYILTQAIKSHERTLLESEVQYQQTLDTTALPSGVVHADLFRDNASFTGNTLSGVFDLYYACHETWLYDLAVVLNDWCFIGEELDLKLFHSLLGGYQSLRPLTALERGLGAGLQRAAALRFWLSRWRSQLNPPAGSLALLKNPDEFRVKLQHLVATALPLQAHWHAL